MNKQKLAAVLIVATTLSGCASPHNGRMGINYMGVSTDYRAHTDNDRKATSDRRLGNAVMLTYTLPLEKEQQKPTSENFGPYSRVAEDATLKGNQTWVWLGVVALAAVAASGGKGGGGKNDERQFLCSLPPTFELKPCDLGIR